MINNVYSIYDKVVKHYGDLVMLENDDVAIRWFIQMYKQVKNSDAKFSPLADHPSDFDLYRIGSFDVNLGDFLKDQNDCIYKGSNLEVTNG